MRCDAPQRGHHVGPSAAVQARVPAGSMRWLPDVGLITPIYPLSFARIADNLAAKVAERMLLGNRWWSADPWVSESYGTCVQVDSAAPSAGRATPSLRQGSAKTHNVRAAARSPEKLT